MAQAAQRNAEYGAQIIDINMGCPAKKVWDVAAGSALLRMRPGGRILEAVVKAVDVPVTLKRVPAGVRISANVFTMIARIAESSGIRALALHGRTREDRYLGDVYHDTIAAVKQSIAIPVIANGDINSPQKARFVLDYTGADAIMIGRAAQGRPWIFVKSPIFLATGAVLPPPEVAEIQTVLLEHLQALYAFYGEYGGCRVARKHIAWYTQGLRGSNAFRQQMYQIEDTQAASTAAGGVLCAAGNVW